MFGRKNMTKTCRDIRSLFCWISTRTCKIIIPYHIGRITNTPPRYILKLKRHNCHCEDPERSRRGPPEAIWHKVPFRTLSWAKGKGGWERSGTRGVISNERERSRFLAPLEMTLELLMKWFFLSSRANARDLKNGKKGIHPLFPLSRRK